MLFLSPPRGRHGFKWPLESCNGCRFCRKRIGVLAFLVRTSTGFGNNRANGYSTQTYSEERAYTDTNMTLTRHLASYPVTISLFLLTPLTLRLSLSNI